MDLVMELKETTEIADEAQTPVTSINLNEASCDELIKFPSTKVSASRTGIKSTHMDQMILLKKMDRNRLKEKPTDDTY